MSIISTARKVTNLGTLSFLWYISVFGISTLIAISWTQDYTKSKNEETRLKMGTKRTKNPVISQTIEYMNWVQLYA